MSCAGSAHRSGAKIALAEPGPSEVEGYARPTAPPAPPPFVTLVAPWAL